MRAATAVLSWTLVCATGWTAVAAADTSMPTPPRGKGEQCVEPTDVMRRDHMRFLTHQRDETTHRGIRTKKHSLVECLECHTRKDAQGKFMPVNAEGEFCNVCHDYSGVTMDCFECHATTPRQPKSASPRASAQPGSDISFRLRITP
jgi:hypothetical protein